MNLHEEKLKFKKDFLLRAIYFSKGNLTVTAKRLGVHRNTVLCLINQLKIDKTSCKLPVRNPSIKKSETNKLRKAIHDFEYSFLKYHIRKNGGFLMRTAREIGVHRNSINNKMTEYNLMPFINQCKTERRMKKWM